MTPVPEDMEEDDDEEGRQCKAQTRHGAGT